MIVYFSFYSLLLPLGRVWGFYHGFKIARDIFTGRDIPREDMPLANLPRAFSRETDRERLMRITAQNIENYGTDLPQQEVK